MVAVTKRLEAMGGRREEEREEGAQERSRRLARRGREEERRGRGQESTDEEEEKGRFDKFVSSSQPEARSQKPVRKKPGGKISREGVPPPVASEGGGLLSSLLDTQDSLFQLGRERAELPGQAAPLYKGEPLSTAGAGLGEPALYQPPAPHTNVSYRLWHLGTKGSDTPPLQIIVRWASVPPLSGHRAFNLQ